MRDIPTCSQTGSARTRKRKRMDQTLDTGASENELVRAKFNELPLRGLRNGGWEWIAHLQLKYTKLRNTEYAWRNHASNLSEDVIFSMNFPTANQYQWNLKQSILKVRDMSLYCTDRLGKQISPKIQILREVQSPAETELQITCQLIQPTLSTTRLVEHLCAVDYGIIIASKLTTFEGKIHMIIWSINPYAVPVTLKTGITIGYFSSTSEEQINNASTSVHISDHSNQSQNSRKSTPTQTIIDQVSLMSK